MIFSCSNMFNETGTKRLNPSGHTWTLPVQYYDSFTLGLVSVLQSELSLMSWFGEIVTVFEQQENDMKTLVYPGCRTKMFFGLCSADSVLPALYAALYSLEWQHGAEHAVLCMVMF